MTRRHLICCLAFSHVDFQAAKLWLQWATYLSRQVGGDCSQHYLVIVGTRRITEYQWGEIMAIIRHQPTFFRTNMLTPPDENEAGYPESSSHLFLRAIEACNQCHRLSAVMFCEPDCAPTRPGWFSALAEDYAARKQPFVGLHIPSTDVAYEKFGYTRTHLMGCSMYPHDAIARAPSIRSCLKSAGGPWAPLADAWDLHCAFEIIPESEQTPLIQQIWRSDPWDATNLNRLSPTACAFHQTKDGSLIRALAERDYPDFIDDLPEIDGGYFLLSTSQPVATIAGREIRFTPCSRTGATLYSVHHSTDFFEYMALCGVAGKRGIKQISRDDYRLLLAQREKSPVFCRA